jgi:hypothetical protein
MADRDSTHHPSPTDYWRWTHSGVEKLFVETCPWASVRVTPASGTTACLGMLFAMYLDLGLHRIGLRGVAHPLIAVIDAIATGVDGRSARMREPGPGGLFANFRIVAEVER